MPRVLLIEYRKTSIGLVVEGTSLPVPTTHKRFIMNLAIFDGCAVERPVDVVPFLCF